jgi:organic hydroperoxide reductase OsmC/OhrA
MEQDERTVDIHCGIDLEWYSSNNVGNIVTPAGNVPCSARGRRQCGEGPSPEILLMAAISSSYSIALSDVLQAAALPQSHISVHADGTIVRDLGRERVARVTVNPTIHGADACRRESYRQAAIAARDGCLIGRSIRGSTAYVVGDVALPQSTD